MLIGVFLPISNLGEYMHRSHLSLTMNRVCTSGRFPYIVSSLILASQGPSKPSVFSHLMWKTQPFSHLILLCLCTFEHIYNAKFLFKITASEVTVRWEEIAYPLCDANVLLVLHKHTVPLDNREPHEPTPLPLAWVSAAYLFTPVHLKYLVHFC